MNAYPLMWSHCLLTGEKPWKKDTLPSYYEGEQYWRNYKGYDRESEKWFDEEYFFSWNTDPFVSRAEKEELDNDLVVLGLTKSPSEEDIKEAFKSKARETHPDKGGTCEAFRRVREAYNNLISMFN